MTERRPAFEEFVELMRRATGPLREQEVPFLLGGGLACWARGGPESDHDVDFLLKRDDAERALEVLANAGFRPERPPEGWLFKAFEDDDLFVDLIFETSAGPVDDGFFDRAEELEVSAVRLQVASLEDVVVTKLLALDEQDLDNESVLEIARTVREQIDWEAVRARTQESPYAKAVFTLIEELGLIEAPSART